MTEQYGKNVISAKISDELLSSMNDVMKYLDIKTRQDLIERAIRLYLSTFKFACDINAISKPIPQYPDRKTQFTAIQDKKSKEFDMEYTHISKNSKSGYCEDCHRLCSVLRSYSHLYTKKWLCGDCIKKRQE